MNKKKNSFNSLLWWLDTSIINSSLVTFKYSKTTNIFFIKLHFFFNFFCINKKNLNSLYFYILDCCVIKNANLYLYYIGYQSFFFDYQILIESKFKNLTNSLSYIYSGISWIERELKESNNFFYLNLNDSRKLLLNYNYSNSIEYNNYNHIINDLLI